MIPHMKLSLNANRLGFVGIAVGMVLGIVTIPTLQEGGGLLSWLEHIFSCVIQGAVVGAVIGGIAQWVTGKKKKDSP
jgi:hypothetical protein